MIKYAGGNETSTAMSGERVIVRVHIDLIAR